MREMTNEFTESLVDHETLVEMPEMEAEGASATQDLLHLNASSNEKDLN